MPSSPRTRTGIAVTHNNAASPTAARRESLKLIIGNPGSTERLKDEGILTDARVSGKVRLRYIIAWRSLLSIALDRPVRRLFSLRSEDVVRSIGRWNQRGR